MPQKVLNINSSRIIVKKESEKKERKEGKGREGPVMEWEKKLDVYYILFI